MSTQTVRSILRIIAAVTVLVGAIGISTTLVETYGIHFVSQSSSAGVEVRGTVASIGLIGVLSWAAVIVWGVAFFRVSPGLARLITSEPVGAPEGSMHGETRRA